MKTVAFVMPDELGDALDSYVSENGVTTSAVIRAAIAAYIQYEGPLERPRKYVSAEERRVIQQRRAQRQREVVHAMIAQFKPPRKSRWQRFFGWLKGE